MNIDFHHILPYVGIIGVLLTQWRFHVTQAQRRAKDRDALVEWRSGVDNRLNNLDSYAKRIEGEYKAADDKFEVQFKELKDGQTKILLELKEVKTSLNEHRKKCEDKK